MPSKGNFSLCLMALALVAGTCLAQDAAPPKFYKLEFVVKEVEGSKVLNTRTYATTVSTKKNCSIRTSSNVPTPTTSDGSQYTYHNLGVNIDCNGVTEMQNGLAMTVAADISSVLLETAPANLAMRQPVVRDNKWDSAIVVPLKKPTVIFSSDDLTTKRQMQLELTATPIT